MTEENEEIYETDYHDLMEDKEKNNKKLQTDANCWEEKDRCNDCPVDFPQKQCPEYRIKIPRVASCDALECENG